MTLILSRSDVQYLLDTLGGDLLEALINRIKLGYEEMARGVVRQHPRIYLRDLDAQERRPPGLFSMSALLPESGYMGTRLLALSSGDGILVLFNYKTLKLLAIMDDSILHNYRTGAPAGLATRYLARKDSRILACIGSSGIAKGALTMVHHVMPSLQSVKVYSPTKTNRMRFAEEMGAQLNMEIKAVDSAEEAVRDADVIITATNADRPVVADDTIKKGAHITLLARNEIELATFRRSKIVTGSIEANKALDPPWRDPIPDEWIHCELSDLIVNPAKGRMSNDEITVFVGSGPLAMWDVCAAHVIYEAGRQHSVGTDVSIDV